MPFLSTNATAVASPLPPPHHNLTPSFMPAIAVIIAILTAIFSLTFLLLLYVKHCKQRNDTVLLNHPHNRFSISRYNYHNAGGGRKNSGIDRSIIESLPVFRFGALSGHKEELECAVCLGKFELTEVLRLLPKCKHAFHVECVDTWLDAHSTCPLCRYRVDPEDILLIGDCNSWFELRFSHQKDEHESNSGKFIDSSFWMCRISGRHSSAGEQATKLNDSTSSSTSKQHQFQDSFRRSLDSSLKNQIRDRTQRRDGLLLDSRFEHRIIVSDGGTKRDERWSEVRASDLLYLRSEMILSDSRKLGKMENGRDVINGRSVSEITSMERRRKWGNNEEQRQAMAVISRWLAWASAGVRSHRTSVSTIV